MKALLALTALALAGCTTITTECRHVAPGQYLACAERFGEDNVELWVLKVPPKLVERTHPNGQKHREWVDQPKHMQVRVRIDGKWLWLENRHSTEVATKNTDYGGVPLEKVDFDAWTKALRDN